MSAGPHEATDAPLELRRQFWFLVGLFNAALLAPAVGLLLIVFDSWTLPGVAMVLVGIAAFALGVWRYRALRADPPWVE